VDELTFYHLIEAHELLDAKYENGERARKSLEDA
jgi:hypothetical protein